MGKKVAYHALLVSLYPMDIMLPSADQMILPWPNPEVYKVNGRGMVDATSLKQIVDSVILKLLVAVYFSLSVISKCQLFLSFRFLTCPSEAQFRLFF